MHQTTFEIGFWELDPNLWKKVVGKSTLKKRKKEEKLELQGKIGRQSKDTKTKEEQSKNKKTKEEQSKNSKSSSFIKTKNNKKPSAWTLFDHIKNKIKTEEEKKEDETQVEELPDYKNPVIFFNFQGNSCVVNYSTDKLQVDISSITNVKLYYERR